MSKETESEVIDALLRILEQERQVILDGRFEELKETARMKEHILHDLASIEHQELVPDLNIVRAKMSENARLLSSVEKGFSQANARLSDIRNAIGQLKTYDGTGKVKASSTTGPTVSLKA